MHFRGACLPAVLHAYDAVRRPASQRVVERSRLNGMLYEMWAPGFADVRAGDVEQLHALGRAVERNWEWAWTTDVEEDVREAVELLEERLRMEGMN